MRFKLTLQVNPSAFGCKIPLNYNYELGSLIYKILSKSDRNFSEWLHENGFQSRNKKFKLFTFSRLHIPEYRIEGGFLRILCDTIEWQLSFLPERSTQEFIQGLFHEQTFELGTREANVQFFVREVSVIAPPSFSDTMLFETLSPICISKQRTDGGIDYLSPDAPQAVALIRQNLLNKYKAFTGKDFSADFDFGFDVLSKPKSSLITIKSGTPAQTRVRGFMCEFRLSAPAELIKIMYEAGVGEKGSTGFGMCKAIP